jgi:hypothetical protein
LEVEAREIDSFFDKRGRFTFKVFHHGDQLLTEQWIDVNALTGNASGGTMESIANQRSIIVHDKDLIICYGLYEAGDGHDLLPAQHQCYITVAPNYADWMRSVAPPGSDRENKPFSRLVLPAAHDAGMNSMASSEAILSRVGGAVVNTLLLDHNNVDPKVREILSRLADKLSADALALVAPNIIFSLAITQKDDLATMLQIGARYFEFRPARLHTAVRHRALSGDALYFQHSAIPGMAYDAFLREVVCFLRDHADEIVVVQLRWDGVPLDVCEAPSDEEKRRYVDEALRQHAPQGEVVVGGLEDMKHASIGQLRRERKRLIVLDSVDSLSTYTDEGNATLDGESIVAALPAVLTRENQRGKAFVNIQCQATASNIPRAVVYSVLEAGVTTSCLLATKGLCDSKTLPWCRDNVVDKCELDQLVVLMNDWIDGATADVAVQLSKQRLER